MQKETPTLYLRHVRGSRVGEIGEFCSGNIRIGRDELNDLSFDAVSDVEVSGRHAMISPRGDTFVIEDLKSLNGTYVNGFRIANPVPLSDGDEIEFAPGGPKLVFSTTPPRVTQQIDRAKLQDLPRVTKSPTLMISDAYRTAKSGGKWQLGNTTSVFFRQLVEEAAQHSSKRLRRTVSLLSLLFVLIVAALASKMILQQEEIVELVSETEKIKTARAEVQAEREALQLESKALQAEINRQARELERLQDLVQALGKGGVSSRVTESGEVSVRLPNVLFEYDAAALAEDGRSKVSHIVSVLESLAPTSRIRVEGHASREGGGNEEYNFKLSQERAEAVAMALVANGFSQGRVETKGFGSQRPLLSNNTEEGRRANRRVEVIVLPPDPSTATFKQAPRSDALKAGSHQKLI